MDTLITVITEIMVGTGILINITAAAVSSTMNTTTNITAVATITVRVMANTIITTVIDGACFKLGEADLWEGGSSESPTLQKEDLAFPAWPLK